MKILEEVLPAGAPMEYLASAEFSTGVYFITYNGIYKQNITGSVEIYSLCDIPFTFNDVVATMHGEYLIFTIDNTQIIYNPIMSHKKTVSLLNSPMAVLVDNYTVINLFYNEIYVYNLSEAWISNYVIENNKLISKYRIRRLFRQEEQMLLVEDKILETNLNLKNKDYQAANILWKDEKTRVNIKRPVLIQPEPTVFCAEPISDIICTAWGCIIKYTTGMEVYSIKDKNYKLEYIYKTTGMIVNKSSHLNAPERVYIKEKDSSNAGRAIIVDISKSGPIKLLCIKNSEKIYAINSTTFMVKGDTDRIVRYRTAHNTYQAPLIELEKEKTIHKKETDLIESSIEYLRKYKDINYILKGATEEENALYIKKILNSFKEDVTIRVISLGVMLEKKISYVKEVSEEIKKMQGTTSKKIEDVMEKNERIISRLGQIIEKIKHIHSQDTKTENATSNEHINALHQKIEEMKQKMQEPKMTKNYTKLQGEYYLLKEHTRYLMKRLELLG
ncbi:hypothetical protein NEIG_00554 [Nematocida sp. ERTm5]|nr:hypothetical protein NEIG_00554 [Nematocida sp. ERTm5]